jgi:ribosomal protein L19
MPLKLEELFRKAGVESSQPFLTASTLHKVSHEMGVEKTSTIVAAVGQGCEGSPRGVSKVIPVCSCFVGHRIAARKTGVEREFILRSIVRHMYLGFPQHGC